MFARQKNKCKKAKYRCIYTKRRSLYGVPSLQPHVRQSSAPTRPCVRAVRGRVRVAPRASELSRQGRECRLGGPPAHGSCHELLSRFCLGTSTRFIVAAEPEARPPLGTRPVVTMEAARHDAHVQRDASDRRVIAHGEVQALVAPESTHVAGPRVECRVVGRSRARLAKQGVAAVAWGERHPQVDLTWLMKVVSVPVRYAERANARHVYSQRWLRLEDESVRSMRLAKG